MAIIPTNNTISKGTVHKRRPYSGGCQVRTCYVQRSRGFSDADVRTF